MTRALLTITSCLALAACGGAAVPRGELTSASAAVRAAEVRDANEVPEARLHLKYARDQIAQAEKLIEEEQHERAARLLRRAEADAEYALMLAKRAEAREETKMAMKKIEELRGGLK